MKRIMLDVWTGAGWERCSFKIVDGFWDQHGKRWLVCTDDAGRVRRVRKA